MTVNLLASIGDGRVRSISNIGVGIVTVNANLSETIDGELTQNVGQWETLDIRDYSLGLWKII
jgi:hypothetical protein